MIVAERTLYWRDGAKDVEIPVRIFAPECEGVGAWRCRYEIGWPENPRSSAGYGFDSMQAVVLTLGMIGAEIYSSDFHKSGNLFWDKPGNGYGFPVAPTLRDLLQGDDKKYL